MGGIVGIISIKDAVGGMGGNRYTGYWVETGTGGLVGE
jgi:hypothetical protein